MEPREHQLETIIGNKILKDLIKKLVEKGTVPHAMLFYGPPGTGKKSFAYGVAKFLNCKGEPKDRGKRGCDCTTCSRISRSLYLDITTLEPKGASQTIRIKNIRELQERAYLTPIEAEKKVCLFFHAERMSVGAANSLLKILEEPPKHLVIILVSDNPHKILPTIRSRCMGFRSSPVPPREIQEWLERTHEIEATQAKTAALLSDGLPGPALEIAKGDFLKRREEMIKELDFLDQNGFAAIFRAANKIGTGSGKLADALSDLLIWYRDLLVSRLAPGKTGLIINVDRKDDIKERASGFSVNGLYEAFHSLLEKQPLGARIINADLGMLVALMDIGSALKKQD